MCLRSYERDQSGNCVPKKCADNSVYNAPSDTCVCNSGYYLSKATNQCEKIPACCPNSKWINQACVCDDGYNWNSDKTACIKCDAAKFEIFNGMSCICVDGYVRDSAGKCGKIVVPPTCGANEAYNAVLSACFCRDGYQKINGACTKIQTCKSN